MFQEGTSYRCVLIFLPVFSILALVVEEAPDKVSRIHEGAIFDKAEMKNTFLNVEGMSEVSY